MTERIVTVCLRACAGPSCLDFILPLFKNPLHRDKPAPKTVHERLMRARSPAISAAREKAARIGAKVRS
jgi:hypothetical protein